MNAGEKRGGEGKGGEERKEGIDGNFKKSIPETLQAIVL
jgi:hypothetical protein